ncbi:MAG: DUF1328 family protein [Ferruginibacter sp.]
MTRWTVAFLIIAMIAAIFAFGGVADGAARIARIMFYVSLVLFRISFFIGRRTV